MKKNKPKTKNKEVSRLLDDIKVNIVPSAKFERQTAVSKGLLNEGKQLRARKVRKVNRNHKRNSKKALIATAPNKQRKDFLVEVWEVVPYILPKKIRIEVYEPAHEDLKADYLRARQSSSGKSWRWLMICFGVRTLLMLWSCFSIMLGAKGWQLIALLIPETVRRWFSSWFSK